MTRILVLLSFLWTVVVGLWAALALEEPIAHPLPPALLIPAAVAALPLVWPRVWTRVTSTLLLLAFSALAGMSVGLFYIPAVVLMGIAALRIDKLGEQAVKTRREKPT